MVWNIAVDVGGTFTDVVAYNTETGVTALEKVFSTPKSQSIGIIDALEGASQKVAISYRDISHALVGSTVVTNLVLEGKGSRVGLLTTKGFKQILHLARAWTPGPLYGWMILKKPDPPADLIDTLEVNERMDPSGKVVESLDEKNCLKQADALYSAGVRAIAIAFLNSYVNPEHEQRAEKIIKQKYPDMLVSLSSAALPQHGEYERALTTVMNAYAKPATIRFLGELESKLTSGGFHGEYMIVRSDGGTMSAKSAMERPSEIAFSGPSGGVVGAAYLANLVKAPNVLTIDIGGTSTDVSLIVDGEATMTHEVSIGYFQLKSRALDVHSVGAGGGSIAHLALTNALLVGPQSAGADPGPACYKRGGTLPTVTDANVVLHRIPPKTKLSGFLQPDEAAASAAIKTIADKINLSVLETAQGILDVVNENMHAAMRVMSIERGHDPRDFALLAFGGAGPLHANALGNLIHTKSIIVPPNPGMMCAFGYLTADVQNEFSKSILTNAENTPVSNVKNIFHELDATAREWLTSEGVRQDKQTLEWYLDCRYFLQDIYIPIRVGSHDLNDSYATHLRRRFEDAHKKRFKFDLESPLEMATARVLARGKTRSIALKSRRVVGADAKQALDRHDEVYFGGKRQNTPIYIREKLEPGNRIQGPAVITQFDSTTVVEPRFEATVDEYENIHIKEVSN